MQEELEQTLAEVLSDVRIPLENVTFILEQYMAHRGRQLDTETRVLLAGIRATVGQVAQSAKQITERPFDVEPTPPGRCTEHQALAS